VTIGHHHCLPASSACCAMVLSNGQSRAPQSWRPPAQGIGGLIGQGLSQRVGTKPQLGDGGIDPIPGRLTQANLAAEHPRDGGFGNAGPIGHILHGNHQYPTVTTNNHRPQCPEPAAMARQKTKPRHHTGASLSLQPATDGKPHASPPSIRPPQAQGCAFFCHWAAFSASRTKPSVAAWVGGSGASPGCRGWQSARQSR
jgi:hypothetical protein